MSDLESWADAVARDLGVDPDVVDVAGILDLARDAAHQVERPAAPLTTFVAGYAAATAAARGEDPLDAVDEALGRASELALGWSAAPVVPLGDDGGDQPASRADDEDGDGNDGDPHDDGSGTTVPDDAPDED
ncbi:hypothetical protein GCM10025865_16990 [Paraoerskovia sediminicola]|uniref:DUF6457 domain-containing protein n=1 Tax=Paraoerskovia sediminicola TaxID=1138587 RepID=A0ABM8G2P8_9CELL|nr:DUF6457 domain-containing protein [Paraoerskovia sediminicola]BDZ42400.1 hypothetical protein GCM10025865_16990 [Paraoerskovia sediminicola]